MASVVEIVSIGIEAWRGMYPDHHIVLDAPAEAVALVDRERLREIVDNLVSNAIKHGGPSRYVHVRVAAAPDAVSITVTDRGRGIPPSELSRIFERFHRVAGQRGCGHGLGLFVAAELTRLHGGTIEVESGRVMGSTFIGTLPGIGPNSRVH